MTPATAAHDVVLANPEVPNGIGGKLIAANCRGLGRPTARRFETFRCAATWQTIDGDSRSTVVWARAIGAGAVCAVTSALAECPPGKPTPLPGDVLIIAEYGTLAELGEPAVVDCTSAGPLAVSCRYDNAIHSGTSSVRFVRNAGGGWSTSVTLTPTA